MTWVHHSIFAAGGERLPADWQAFSAQTGAQSILHQRPGAPARFEGRAPEAFLWLDLEDERQAGLEERRLAAGFISESLAQGRRVLLHGSLGRHRIRWAFVAYRIYNGRSAHAALREAAARPWLAPYPTDVAAWEAFEAVLRARPEEEG